MIRLLLTSGRGPGECRIALARTLGVLASEAEATGLDFDVATGSNADGRADRAANTKTRPRAPSGRCTTRLTVVARGTFAAPQQGDSFKAYACSAVIKPGLASCAASTSPSARDSLWPLLPACAERGHCRRNAYS